MAITLLIGTPGSGKSYTAVKNSILPAVKSGRPVVTNIPLNLEEFKKDFPDYNKLTVIPSDTDATKFISLISAVPGGVLIVLDEIWRYWSVTIKKPDLDSEQLFAMHRHKSDVNGISQDIVILTQGSTDVPAFIRTRVDNTIICTKLTLIGFNTRYRLNYYSGCVSSLRPSKTKLLSEEYSSYENKYYKYYQTHSDSASNGGVVNEIGTMKRRTIFQGFRLVGFFIVFVIAVLVLLYRFTFLQDGTFVTSFFSDKPVATKHVPTKHASVKRVSIKPKDDKKSISSVPNVGATNKSKVTSLLHSRYWIVGSVSNDSYQIILITDGGNYLNVSVKKGDCTLDGILFCTVGNALLSTIPIAKSVVDGRFCI